MHRAAGIILAGGKSTRMGRNKALLPLGEQSLLATIAALLRPLFAEIIVVSNTPEAYQDLDARLVEDIIPGRGPLSGIHAGLAASSYWHNFVVACDMPFLEQDLIDYLLQQAPGYDVVVPRRGEYLEPLHAVYSRGCLPVIEEHLKQGKHKTIAFYPRVKVRYLGVEEYKNFDNNSLERIFLNINTPDDFMAARRLAACFGKKDQALSPELARELLLRGLKPCGVEKVALEAAAGRVLAAAAVAAEPFPPFSRSRMDGYALGPPAQGANCRPVKESKDSCPASASGAATIAPAGNGNGGKRAGQGSRSKVGAGGAGAAPGRYRLLGTVAAGSDVAITISAGTAAAIFTGARLPQGAVTVVPREMVVCQGQYIFVPDLPGTDYIEPAAAEISAGEEVLAGGTVLKAAEIGLLAILGRREVEVYRRPRLLLAASGNELTEPGDASLPAAHIYNSNYYALAAAAAADGAGVMPLGTLPDDPEQQAAVYREALARGDLLLTSGGAGGGAYDFTAAAFTRAGGELIFTQLNICPGRRTIAARAGQKLMLGLPGTPPAALAIYYLLVAPLIRALGGRPPAAETFPARLAAAVDRGRPQRSLLWARAVPGSSGWQVTPLPRRPGGLRGAVGANALLDLPAGAKPAVGEEVMVMLLNGGVIPPGAQCEG
ncbi:MAG: NTP transferase domain-containing protein [Clostridia bacterium]|nr:NTP transferase domain-containing protein [Clostridia bacterium]